MLIDYNPGDFISESWQSICPFHKEHPGKPFAGCTCTYSWSQRKKTEEEKASDKIEEGVKRLINEYGEVIRRLADA